MDKRAKITIGIILFISVVLVLQIIDLQLINDKYKIQAQKTTLAKKILNPDRGQIRDRNNKLLVANSSLYDLECIYKNVDNLDTNLFCQLLDINIEYFVQNVNKNWNDPRFSKSTKFTFLSRIPLNRYSLFQEHLFKFSGFYPVRRSIRTYPYPYASHILGFMGEVNQKEISNNPHDYKLGDFIGKSGIERAYEKALKGRKGIAYIMRNNKGAEMGSFNNGDLDSMATSGYAITTTLDIDLQSFGERLMTNKKGAIVCIEPSTGEILTLVSSPSYDPALLTLNKSRSIHYDSLRNDTVHNPLYNRAVLAQYPPGSIFKTILSLIAMNEKVWHTNRHVHCNGAYKVDERGKYIQACHKHSPAKNVMSAIQYSCNSYYFQMFREFIDSYGYKTPNIGLEKLISYLHRLGLGNKLNIDFPTESKGYLPSSALYDHMYKDIVNGWRSSYILSLGIGQGELQFTTLQMANIAAILANRGWYYTPHFLKHSDNLGVKNSNWNKNHTGIDAIHFEPVIEGMSRVITLGTGKMARVANVEICGKTGTSQNNHGKDHSVFIAFAPRNSPKIAIAVYVENAGFGGQIAAPIAGLIIDKYINGNINGQRKKLYDHVLQIDLINE